MFGETHSESPRLPSPWLSRGSSGGSTPSPLALATPDINSTSGRRRSSLETLELLDGLAEDFDAIALGRGKLSASPAMEEIAVKAVGMETLDPEVDHQGHIEYKLKLLTPTSLHRLEKLRTQLKWRLVEGGGLAVYELGVLDDGTLVGLAQSDMDESLRTLGQMLAGLGGGHVQVTRVVRLGGGGRCGSGSAEDTTSAASSAPTSPGALFPSFSAPYDGDDLAFIASSASLCSTPTSLGGDPIASGNTRPTPRGPMPSPSTRTPDEQAERRRAKRDARRAQRREADCHRGEPTSPHASQAQRWPVRVPPRDRAPKPPKPPRAARGGGTGTGARRSSAGSSASSEPEGDGEPAPDPDPDSTPSRPDKALSAPKSPPGAESLYKPALLREGDTEVRYVVEAVVCKAVGGGASDEGGRRRRKSSAAHAAADGGTALELFAAADTDNDVGTDDANDPEETVAEGDEGWSFLEFDLAHLSASVKTAAAAAASAAAVGRAPRPIATVSIQA
ncbi:hypothetical protein JCM3770_000772 [Rhodotorula araucariae]